MSKGSQADTWCSTSLFQHIQPCLYKNCVHTRRVANIDVFIFLYQFLVFVPVLGNIFGTVNVARCERYIHRGWHDQVSKYARFVVSGGSWQRVCKSERAQLQFVFAAKPGPNIDTNRCTAIFCYRSIRRGWVWSCGCGASINIYAQISFGGGSKITDRFQLGSDDYSNCWFYTVFLPEPCFTECGRDSCKKSRSTSRRPLQYQSVTGMRWWARIRKKLRVHWLSSTINVFTFHSVRVCSTRALWHGCLDWAPFCLD